jgi:hypothetical protein
MENSYIEEVEDSVIALREKLRFFGWDINFRSSGNYNHLGTLNVNLSVLKTEIEDLQDKLGFNK